MSIQIIIYSLVTTMYRLLGLAPEQVKGSKDLKARSLKGIRALVSNYMDAGIKEAKFHYEPLSESFEIDSDQSMIGSVNKDLKAKKKKSIDEILDNIDRLYYNRKENNIEDIAVLVDDICEHPNVSTNSVYNPFE